MKPEDIDDLKQLVEFLKENQVAEFALDRGDVKIQLKFIQPVAPSVTHVLASAPGMIAAAAPMAVAPSAPAPAAAAAPAPENDPSLHLIKSPIVGTYYGSPSPGASAFVGPGDHVEKGQVVCIVEAMKLMNEIESDIDGEIVKALVTNGQPIEYGQPLFAVRPA
ncbi:MAG TPA: acetyl-CoA carboxylase biotin carboxyl carrier protein [Terracidiphilus sp.]|jgi:acetyl-CoA carboxylase biotin carboxyl carrier protein